ncbi:MAG TPA: phosphodiesterase [Clostridia bacterium]|nr:phosphodiesterase [Clostridia bacterium]
MKLIIASDIHGSATSLRTILSKASKTDKVILLGDIYNHGPRNPLPEGWAPMEVASLLNDFYNAHGNKLTVIHGNCDSEVDQMISKFKFKKKYTLHLDRKLFFSHGHKFNIDNPPADIKSGATVFYGHFHIPVIEEKSGVFFVNPGSCALPFQGNPKSYATYENGKITILDLNDNVIMEKQL